MKREGKKKTRENRKEEIENGSQTEVKGRKRAKKKNEGRSKTKRIRGTKVGNLSRGKERRFSKIP